MCGGHRTLTWTLVLLLLSGALCNKWNVKYEASVICAVRGSSVVIPCSFHYPDKMTVQDVMWGHERNDLHKGPFLFESNSVKSSSKFEYVGDKRHICSLKVHSVEHNDHGKYVFRFTTNIDKWTAVEGSTLKIIDLKVKSSNGNRATKEGDSVELTCINSCDNRKRSSAILWFKNGEPIAEEPSLRLHNISSSSSGNYSCSLRSHEGTTSGVIRINVEYGPKNTTTSVRSSLEVDPGSNIRVSCSSSDANPPVENYSWFKIHNDDITIVGNKSELFITEFTHVDNGQYFCSATNKHASQNSSIVTLKVKECFSYSVIVAATAAAVTALLVTLAVVTAVRKLNRKGTTAPEGECAEDTQDAVYTNWPVSDNSQSQAETTDEPFYATIVFSNKRESNMQQQTGTCNEDVMNSVIYGTVWR